MIDTTLGVFVEFCMLQSLLDLKHVSPWFEYLANQIILARSVRALHEPDDLDVPNELEVPQSNNNETEMPGTQAIDSAPTASDGLQAPLLPPTGAGRVDAVKFGWQLF